MKLYLLRHGHAASATHDSPKSLSPQGRAEVQLIGSHFKKNRIEVGNIWHSPKTRAAETARLFQAASGNHSAVLEEKEGLKPEGDPQGMLQELGAFQGGSLLLATHLPFVADLAAVLAGNGAGRQLVFPTAGLAAFEREGGDWKWTWSLDPSTLR